MSVFFYSVLNECPGLTTCDVCRSSDGRISAHNSPVRRYTGGKPVPHIGRACPAVVPDRDAEIPLGRTPWATRFKSDLDRIRIYLPTVRIPFECGGLSESGPIGRHFELDVCQWGDERLKLHVVVYSVVHVSADSKPSIVMTHFVGALIGCRIPPLCVQEPSI